MDQRRRLGGPPPVRKKTFRNPDGREIQMKKAFLLPLPLAVLAAGCSGSRAGLKKAANAGDEIVDVEGMAPYKANDIPGSRAAAIAAAQRSAVDLVEGVYATGKPRPVKAIAIRNNILATTQADGRKCQ